METMEMTKTLDKINQLMKQFQDWGMLDNLTEREKIQIREELKSIAGSAIMEAHNKVQNILPSLYNQITR